MIHSHYNITAIPFGGVLSEQHQSCLESIQTLLDIEALSTHQQLVHRYSHTGALWIPSVSYLECRNTGFLCASIYHGNTGFYVIFIQLWLSHRITVVSKSMLNRPDISFQIHMDSQLAKQAAIYSASVVLRATLNCFLLNHEIIADPRQKHPPDVLFLSETLPTQSISV